MARVVLDTNFAGRGRFDRAALERLARTVAGSGAVLVIPEVVIWEWAEHAARDHAALLKAAEETKVDPSLIDASTLAPLPPTEELVERIRANLPAGYEVAEAQADDYRAALREQVLQIGSGERKEGVKTGAADALIRSCVGRELLNRPAITPVVLASGDKNLAIVCEGDSDGELLIARNQKELLERLIEFVPATDELRERLEEDLGDQIIHGGVAAPLVRFAAGFDIVSRASPATRWERERLRLTDIDIVELEDLKVEVRDDGTRLAATDARLFGTVELDVSTIEPVGDPEEGDFERVPVWHGTMDGMIDVPLTMTLDSDWNVVSIEQAGEAVVDFSP